MTNEHFRTWFGILARHGVRRSSGSAYSHRVLASGALFGRKVYHVVFVCLGLLMLLNASAKGAEPQAKYVEIDKQRLEALRQYLKAQAGHSVSDISIKRVLVESHERDHWGVVPVYEVWAKVPRIERRTQYRDLTEGWQRTIEEDVKVGWFYTDGNFHAPSEREPSQGEIKSEGLGPVDWFFDALTIKHILTGAGKLAISGITKMAERKAAARAATALEGRAGAALQEGFGTGVEGRVLKPAESLQSGPESLDPQTRASIFKDWQAGKRKTSFENYLKRRMALGRGEAGERGDAFVRGGRGEIVWKAPKGSNRPGSDLGTYDSPSDLTYLHDNKAIQLGDRVSASSALQENLADTLRDDIKLIEGYMNQPGVPPEIPGKVLPRLRAAYAEIEPYTQEILDKWRASNPGRKLTPKIEDELLRAPEVQPTQILSINTG
jgi:hypothetical protein